MWIVRAWTWNFETFWWTLGQTCQVIDKNILANLRCKPKYLLMLLHLAESLRWMKSVGRWRTRRGERGKTCDENAEIIGRIGEFYQKCDLSEVIWDILMWSDIIANYKCDLKYVHMTSSGECKTWVGEWERARQEEKLSSNPNVIFMLWVVIWLSRAGDSRTGPRPSPREFRGRWPDDVGHKTAML